MNNFPKLFKKTQTGKIQTWEICVIDNTIYIEFGQLDSDNKQSARDTITQGKNIGRSNETTIEEQATAEALSKWEKQIKSGYIESLDKAQIGEEERQIIRPMLAHSFDKQAKKLNYPCYIQPKLDGIRCIARIQKGVASLQTRSGEPIESMPHITHSLISFYGHQDIIFDGELFNDKISFEEITSLVRKQKGVNPNHEKIEYHIYDIVDHTRTFTERFVESLAYTQYPFIHFVETRKAEDETELLSHYKDFVDQGYEGGIARNEAGMYVGHRSYDLLKIKDFLEDDFLIKDVVSGRGKMEGLGIFLCVTSSGLEFSVKCKGELESLRKYLKNKEYYIGKMLTVIYQNLTTDGLPRFPIGKSIRDYE